MLVEAARLCFQNRWHVSLVSFYQSCVKASGYLAVASRPEWLSESLQLSISL